MIPGVGIDGVQYCYEVPEPSQGQVGLHYDWSDYQRQTVAHNMLQGMGVDADNAHWCRPLMMCLVNVLVQHRMMKQSTCNALEKM